MSLGTAGRRYVMAIGSSLCVSSPRDFSFSFIPLMLFGRRKKSVMSFFQQHAAVQLQNLKYSAKPSRHLPPKVNTHFLVASSCISMSHCASPPPRMSGICLRVFKPKVGCYQARQLGNPIFISPLTLYNLFHSHLSSKPCSTCQ